MKLHQLVEERAADFEHEEHPEFTSENSKVLGTFDGYEIIGSSHYKELVTLAIKLDDKPAAYLFFKDDEVEGGFHPIEKVWVDPAHRGKGLAASLIGFAVEKMHLKLGSGEAITKDGQKLFSRFIKLKSFKFKVWNLDSKEFVDVDPSETLKLPNRYELVITEGWRGRDRTMFEQHTFMTKFRGRPFD